MTSQTIAQTLQNDILSGALPPGTPLSQSELATQFGVSRIPVRDALAQLAACGLITTRPNRTATVLKMSAAEVEETYHMRILLEGDLLMRAVPRMTEAHFTAIEYALKRSSLEAVQDNWATGDQMFHQTLYAAAESPHQSNLADDLRRACRVQIAGYSKLTGKTARWLRDHEEIVTACQSGNAKEAQRRLRRHLKAARNLLLRVMQEKLKSC